MKAHGGWGSRGPTVGDRTKEVMFRDDQAATAMEKGDGIMQVFGTRGLKWQQRSHFFAG